MKIGGIKKYALSRLTSMLTEHESNISLLELGIFIFGIFEEKISATPKFGVN